MPEDANATGIIIPWSAELGFRLLSVGDGLCSLRLPWRPDLSGSNGGIASGAIASLIDHACGAAVMSRLERVSISTLCAMLGFRFCPRLRDFPDRGVTSRFVRQTTI